MSDLPVGPTASLDAAYANAIARACLVADCIIDAMQMRPESSWSATARKRSRGARIDEVKFPSASTSERAFRRASRGTRTWL